MARRNVNKHAQTCGEEPDNYSPPLSPCKIVTDCAVCSDGYGMGLGSSCHACDNTGARLLITLGALFSLLIMIFLVLAVIFLIGGLDAIVTMRESVVSALALKDHNTFENRERSSGNSTADARNSGNDGNGNLCFADPDSSTATAIAPDLVLPPTSFGGGDTKRDVDRAEGTQKEEDGVVLEHVKATGDADTSVSGSASGRRRVVSGTMDDTTVVLYRPERPKVVDLPRRGVSVVSPKVSVSGHAHVRNESKVAETATASTAGLASMQPGGNGQCFADDGQRSGDGSEAAGAGHVERESRCCGMRLPVERWMSRLPLDKIKILVVVWQILTVFPGIAAVEFPSSYARFLNWIDVVNLDLGYIFSATCLLPVVTHYERLLATTLVPLILGGVLLCTYQVAKRRAGIGSAGVMERRSAWSRHTAAGLLLTFLVSAR